eukprot:CAMPEP_0119372414 /NCGR_PEP_ID=MMETSP1334-20130426/18797_1 /TAXON_ID=127549 /ORGANISM="Calcidiscus leptoporus, Strain RCC1130" /LENGTH=33 /DNA_ID= /DNA_START= /DNA_END= /DNA_ORIENTATION=
MKERNVARKPVRRNTALPISIVSSLVMAESVVW